MSLDFLDDITFELNGQLSCPVPAHLFVSSIPVLHIDGMPCVNYPLSDSLFYWSLDPTGENVISKQNWDRYGIPKLEVHTHVGAWWDSSQYAMVANHLRTKGYPLDGKQYAQDHGYPELILGGYKFLLLY